MNNYCEKNNQEVWQSLQVFYDCQVFYYYLEHYLVTIFISERTTYT